MTLLNCAIINYRKRGNNIMKKVLFEKNDVKIISEFGDVTLYSPYLMVVKEDTPENRKAIFDIAGVKEI